MVADLAGVPVKQFCGKLVAVQRGGLFAQRGGLADVYRPAAQPTADAVEQGDFSMLLSKPVDIVNAVSSSQPMQQTLVIFRVVCTLISDDGRFSQNPCVD